MNAVTVESTDRRSKDFFHFGLTALGAVICAGGLIIVSWRTIVCGMVLIVFGLAYFALED